MAAMNMDMLLSAVEVVRRDPEDLEGCETLIVANYQRNNWLKVGAALLVIHDTALYKKSGADSFSNYVSTKADFGFGPRQALRLLAATKMVKIFPPTIALPTSERQVGGEGERAAPRRAGDRRRGACARRRLSACMHACSHACGSCRRFVQGMPLSVCLQIRSQAVRVGPGWPTGRPTPGPTLSSRRRPPLILPATAFPLPCALADCNTLHEP